MINETDLITDLMILLDKHKLANCILLVPIGEEGTSCFRINASESLAVKIMQNVAKDIATGNCEFTSHSGN